MVAVGCGTPAPDSRKAGDGITTGQGDAARFKAVARAYIAEYAAAYPVTATEWGVHTHDRSLRDMSQAGIQARVGQAKAMLAELADIDRRALQGDAYYDHRLIEYALRAELLELEEVRNWQREPMMYNSEIARGMATLVDRAFAPLDQRMESLIVRFDAIPNVITAAQSNLRDVPALWAKLGLKLTRGTISYMKEDLVAGLEAQGLAQVDGDLVGRWRAAHQRAVAAVRGPRGLAGERRAAQCAR